MMEGRKNRVNTGIVDIHFRPCGWQENGIGTKVFSEKHVAHRISYHNRFFEIDQRKLFCGFESHPGIWFSKRVVIVQLRAIKNSVYTSFIYFDLFTHVGVYGVQVF